MNQQEEIQYLSQERIEQEEPVPSPLMQAIIILSFLGFIVALPTIIEKLSK
jgi:hypothetical protein